MSLLQYLPALACCTQNLPIDVRCSDARVQYAGTLPAELAMINIDLICPATDKHISKHTAQEHVMVGSNKSQ